MKKYFAPRLLALLFLSICCFSVFVGCGGNADNSQVTANKTGEESSQANEEEKGSVTFIDVGEGDSIYIKFPDGKNMLIDCGEEGNVHFEKISETIKASGKSDLDYLVLTHVDSDHTGGAAEIIEKFPVKKAYIPLVFAPERYPSFNDAKTALEECGAETEVSAKHKRSSGEDFFFTFLSPAPTGFPESEYAEFNGVDEPSEQVKNDISAVIYLDMCGVRFLFTGDAGEDVEERILIDYVAGLFSIGGGGVCLEGIDFLKVSHHGADDASSEEFLAALRPKNAVISTGYNHYGHPATATLKRFVSVCGEDCEIFRTDVCGSVKVAVGKGGYKVYNELQ